MPFEPSNTVIATHLERNDVGYEIHTGNIERHQSIYGVMDTK